MRPAPVLLSAPIALLASLASTSPVQPSDDPFYEAPSLTPFRPGDAIRSRAVPLTSLNPRNASLPWPIAGANQYLYRTVDSLGKPAAAVTTILTPLNASQPSKLLSYQSAYDSANLDCSVSYTLQTDASAGSTDRALISASLAQGWYVAVPDYEGLGAQYAAGVQSGHATLDSIRLALSNSNISGLAPDSATILWGYSGGALASEWALELQQRYAPDLHPRLVGAALGGLVPNLTDFVLTINNGPDSGLTYLGLEGLAKAYPNLTAYIDQHLYVNKSMAFYAIADQCTVSALVKAANSNVFEYFDTGSHFLTDEVPASVLKWAGQMGLHGVPQVPVFAYKSEGDQVSPIRDADLLISRFCREGAKIHYLRDSVGNHNTEAITGGALAFQWILDRFSGRFEVEGEHCATQNVSLHSANVSAVSKLGPRVITYLRDELLGEGVE